MTRFPHLHRLLTGEQDTAVSPGTNSEPRGIIETIRALEGDMGAPAIQRDWRGFISRLIAAQGG